MIHDVCALTPSEDSVIVASYVNSKGFLVIDGLGEPYYGNEYFPRGIFKLPAHMKVKGAGESLASNVNLANVPRIVGDLDRKKKQCSAKEARQMRRKATSSNLLT